MKKHVFYFFMILFVISSCGGDDEDDDGGNNSGYKDYMREFVQDLSSYAKEKKSGFIIIPQNGHELVSDNGDNSGGAHIAYNAAIDACGQEDLFYGYNNDDEATPKEDNEYLCDLLDIAKGNDNTILVTDYCSTHSKMDDSYAKNAAKGYISYAASSRELEVPSNYPATPNNENSDDINSISDVKNFLYLINPEMFNSKNEFIQMVGMLNYDLIIMDYFFDDKEEWTPSEVEQLKNKANGGKRLVVSYMSIGEAEDYRYYWQSSWESSPPEWLDEENPDWEGNYKVKYWEQDWQDIIFGSNNAYLDKIINAGFDGVYLDIIEAFEYYE